MASCRTRRGSFAPVQAIARKTLEPEMGHLVAGALPATTRFGGVFRIGEIVGGIVIDVANGDRGASGKIDGRGIGEDGCQSNPARDVDKGFSFAGRQFCNGKHIATEIVCVG